MMAEIENTKKLYGVLIRVKNIDQMRSFYRDVLLMGPPEVDSNYWVEFKLSDDLNLILELIENEQLPGINPPPSPPEGSVLFVYKINDLDEFARHLETNKLSPISEEKERFGKRVIRYMDPEGNHFYLLSEK
jgi:catechol 2,3-dioxygenase-like lactoylglutathione lyase family enzyme